MGGVNQQIFTKFAAVNDELLLILRGVLLVHNGPQQLLDIQT